MQTYKRSTPITTRCRFKFLCPLPIRQIAYVVLSVGVAALLSAGSAAAEETGFTLDASVPFNLGGATGSIDPVMTIDPNLDSDQITCLDGTCSLANQDWLVFTITIASGALDELGMAALFGSSQGLGYFNLSSGETPDAGDSTSDPTTPTFKFHVGADGGLTGTSVALFVAYANGALPSNFGPGLTNFMVAPVGKAATTSRGVITTQIDILTELATAHPLGGRFARIRVFAAVFPLGKGGTERPTRELRAVPSKVIDLSARNQGEQEVAS